MYSCFYPSVLNKFLKSINKIIMKNNGYTVLQDFNSIGLVYSKLILQSVENNIENNPQKKSKW